MIVMQTHAGQINIIWTNLSSSCWCIGLPRHIKSHTCSDKECSYIKNKHTLLVSHVTHYTLCLKNVPRWLAMILAYTVRLGLQ